MKIFLDANILVSVLNKEYPLFTYSARVIGLVDKAPYQVYVSPISLAIAFYFAEKKSGTTLAKKKIEILLAKLKVTSVDQEIAIKAISNKSILDFEDGMQYYAAEKAKCKCIVTEDKSDYHFSKIEILNARDFLGKYVL